MEYRLTIPGRLANLNDLIRAERANKYKGGQLKADNEKIARVAIRKCLRGVEIIPPVFMEYHWIEKNTRRDLDNISSFGRKVIQDALVKEGILRNDGWKDIVGFADCFEVDKGNPRIEVFIREV